MQKIILAYNFTPERLQALKLICMMLRTQLRAVAREELLHDLHALPKQATVRKVNELCKRARLSKTNAYLTAYLREHMPTIGKDKKAELLNDLNGVFNVVLH